MPILIRKKDFRKYEIYKMVILKWLSLNDLALGIQLR